MRKLLALVVLSVMFTVAQAQTASSKIGSANVGYIFSQMPEFKQVESDLKTTETMLRNQIQSKAQEFQAKVDDYNKNLNNMLEAVRANTERELQQLQDNLQKLQQDAQSTLQKKEVQLMEPLYKKVGKAIEDVAKENGYTFILNQDIGGQDVILYGDPDSDVSDLVLKKMGITPKPAEASSTTPKQ